MTDVNKVIERIISIIQKKNSDDSLGLRNVKYAEPDYEIYDDPPPYSFVKLARDYQSTENKIGRSEGVEPQQIIHLKIGVISFGKNVETAQKMQLPITEGIKSALYNNRTLKHPESNDDPLSVRLNIERTSRLTSKQGQEITGSLISLQIQIGVTNQITINGIEIPILGITGDDIWNTEDIPDDDGKRDVGPVMLSKKRYIKYQANAALVQTLETIHESAKPITVSLMEDGISKTKNIFLKRISPATELNGQMLSTMEIEILK
ncbi:MAG: hypothetical protein HRU07_06660 [Nitrosopumilus sp.]|nr:hypothetical protein [Nitrosopumilus sp.]NRA05822.1 hypothetical protein [Nitrosopumilus sp.]